MTRVMSDNMRKRWADPVWRARQVEIIKATWARRKRNVESGDGTAAAASGGENQQRLQHRQSNGGAE